MTTREHIEQITDSGLFESLATAVIREMRPDLEAVLHTGTNAKGQAIKGPLDGFLMIEYDGEAKFISIQHTIDQNLKKKWLHEDEGDIIKTERELKDLRAKFPNAQFELILTTSLRVDKELAETVYSKCHSLNLKSTIYDQSVLEHFLDHKGAGQWLRRKFLGLDYQHLSFSALLELSEIDSRNYHLNFWLPDTNKIIHRKSIAELKPNTVTTLVGNSGYGKSAIAFKLWESALTRQQVFFWLDAGLVGKSIQFAECLKDKLLKLKPNLYLTHNDLWYLKEFWDNSVFIVDDINQAPNKKEAVKRILQWHEQLTNDGFNVSFLVPLWEDNHFQELKANKSVTSFLISKYTVQECRTILAESVTNPHKKNDHFILDRIANELEYDPLLINFFKESVKSDEDFLSETSRNTIQTYIDDCSLALQEQHSTLIMPQIKMALDHLSSRMIEEKNFYPKFSDAAEWFKNDPHTLEVINLFVKQGKLLNVTIEGVYNFRHDRVRDELLSHQFYNLGDLSKNSFKEPYYSHLIGQALAASKVFISTSTISWLLQENPLSVFEFIRNDPDKALTPENVEIIIRWITEFINVNHHQAIEDRVKSLLFFTDSEKVLDLVNAFERYDYALGMTGMKNGAIEFAIIFLSNHFGKHLNDHFDFREREVIKRIKTRYKDKAAMQIKTYSTTIHNKTPEPFIAGLLSYIAVVEAEDNKDVVEDIWNSAVDKQKFYKYFIKAYLNSGGKLNSSFINRIFKSIEDTDDKKIWEDIKQSLPSIVKDNTPEISYIIEEAKRSDFKRNIFIGVIINKDSRETIQFILEDYPKRYPINVRDEIIKGYWSSENARKYYSYSTDWNPRGFHGSKTLSDDSVGYLLSEWSNEGFNETRRWFAFFIWKHYAKKSDIKFLQSINETSFLYDVVYMLRLELGDYECLSSIESKAQDNPYLISHCLNVWGDQMKQIAGRYFKTLKTDKLYDTSENGLFLGLALLLTEIPISDSEELMVENWSTLKHYDDFVGMALYIDLDRINQLATDTIASLPDKSWAFKSIHWTFGGNNKKRRELITVAKLERLKPYFEYIKEFEISQLIDSKNKVTFEWWRKNVPSGVQSFYDKYFPTDLQIQRSFENHKGRVRNNISLDLRIEELEKYGVDSDRILSQMSNWLTSKKSINSDDFEVACRVVSLLGSRVHLSILTEALGRIIENQQASTLTFENVKNDVLLNSLT